MSINQVSYRDLLRRTVNNDFSGNKTAAAREWDMSRQHLDNILKGDNVPTLAILKYTGHAMIKRPPVFIKRPKKWIQQ